MVVRVRAAQASDLAALNEIYTHYVQETAITFDVGPTSLPERRAWFEQFGATGRHRLLVAEDAGRIVGYAGSLRFRPKLAYLTSVESTIYVRPGATGTGIGRSLYTELFALLANEDVHRAYAAITLPNPASIVFHERFGFQPVGVFREVGRKFSRYWDVAWYEKDLG